MGYTRHHGIVVTSYDENEIKIAHNKAIELFGSAVSSLIPSNINGYLSIFIAPDGSKEGWPESELGDHKREIFIDWINAQAYEDGSNSLKFAELYYGDDEGESKIVNHN